MYFNFWNLITKPLKQVKFWRDNYFLLREFQYFSLTAVLAFLLTLVTAALEGSTVGLILAFLHSLNEQDGTPLQTGIAWFDIWFLGVKASPIERIYRTSGLILIVTWLRSIFSYFGGVYSYTVQIKLLDRLRKQIFEQLQNLSLSYFSRKRTGELIHSLTTELERLSQVFDVISFLLVRSATLLAYIISMVLISWQLSFISLFLFGLLTVGLSGLIRKVRESSFAISKAGEHFASVALEFINGIRTVKTFASNEFERKRFYLASETIVKARIESLRIQQLIEPLGEGVAISILITMVVVAFKTLVIQGSLPVASLLTFLFVLFRLVPIVRQVNGARTMLNYFEAPLSSLRELLRTDDKPYLANGKAKFPGLKTKIEFVSVYFGYESSQLVLRDLSLTIHEGQTTALVGASGAGKTTLANLIPRFYDPNQGEILIDGADLRQFEINSLRSKIAIVSQDIFLFNASVRDNIAYGLEEAEEFAIQEAARIANAWEFIQELPEGFHTQLGDRGVRLSGGQRQRLAIARAVLRKPEILILDEATSALDSVSERLIQESLDRILLARTVIAIAHRLSTLVRADQIFVLERGQIVEKGTYQELLEKRSQFWQYHQLQFDQNGIVSHDDLSRG